MLEVVMVNPIPSPAETEGASAFLSTFTSGHSTVMEAEAALLPCWAWASLVACPVAELFTVPHVAGVVGEVMCTVLEAPEARLPKLQERTPAVIEQLPCPVPPSMDHEVPVLVGRASVRVTPL